MPCGVTDGGITSLHDLGKKVSLDDLDSSLKKNLEKVFGNYGLFRVS